MSAILNNNDLRSEAKSFQRDKNHRTKWSKGVESLPGQHCTHRDSTFWSGPCPQCAVRPVHRHRHRRTLESDLKYWPGKHVNHTHTLARKAYRNEVSEAMDGPLANISDASSDNDDVRDTSAAPVPDAEIMYSFDAFQGPSRGGDVLSHAVTQALQRFENTETEKLVNKEYDVVEESKDGYAADEDDEFEMIDHSHLN